MKKSLMSILSLILIFSFMISMSAFAVQAKTKGIKQGTIVPVKGNGPSVTATACLHKWKDAGKGWFYCGKKDKKKAAGETLAHQQYFQQKCTQCGKRRKVSPVKVNGKNVIKKCGKGYLSGLTMKESVNKKKIKSGKHKGKYKWTSTCTECGHKYTYYKKTKAFE